MRSDLILALLKDPEKKPEVREELMRVVRNGRMLIETSWRSEEGRGQFNKFSF